MTGFDYTQFKLFQLSILWRCSVTSIDFFKIDLGDHSETLMQMILSEDPGEEDDYACNVSAINTPNGILNCLILRDDVFDIQGHKTCRIIFGGFIWHFYVSIDPKPVEVKESFLKKNGNLIILKADFSKIEFLMKEAEKLNNSGLL